jgi:hypothetical protein
MKRLDVARFYANENLPEQVVVELRRLGHDVMMMRDSGHAGRAVPDASVLDQRIHAAAQTQPDLVARLVRINRPS